MISQPRWKEHFKLDPGQLSESTCSQINRPLLPKSKYSLYTARRNNSRAMVLILAADVCKPCHLNGQLWIVGSCGLKQTLIKPLTLHVVLRVLLYGPNRASSLPLEQREEAVTFHSPFHCHGTFSMSKCFMFGAGGTESWENGLKNLKSCVCARETRAIQRLRMKRKSFGSLQKELSV